MVDCIGGTVAEGIVAVLDVIFFFGFALPWAQMLAVRLRSIGTADLGDCFVLSFMEAAMGAANQAMNAGFRSALSPLSGRSSLWIEKFNLKNSND